MSLSQTGAALSRRRMLATAGAGMAGLHAACAPGGSNESSSAVKEPQHLQIWWPFGSHNLAVEESWNDFQSKHPGWTAEINFKGSYDKFLTGVAAGDVPDVYMPASPFVLEASAKGMLRPLDQFISRDKIDWKQYFIAAQIGADYKSKRYGMPHHVDVYSVYANDKVLREGGFDPKKNPGSWDELMATNPRLKKMGPEEVPARWGFIPTWGIGAFPLFYFPANGVSLVSQDGTKVAFDTRAGLEAMEWVGTATKDLGGWEQITAFQKQFTGGVGTALGQDAVGYGYSGVWILAYSVYKTSPDAEISQWNLPGGPSARGKDVGHFIADYDVIPTESKKADAAWLYIKHDASPAGQKYVQSVPGAWDIATIPSVANDAESLKKQPWRKRANELMATAKHPSYFPHPGSREIDRTIGQVVKPFLEGKEGARATMDNLKREVQLLMDQFGAGT